MATVNPFDLLGGDDNDDPSQLIAAVVKKPAAAPPAAAKLPSKPLPPAQAVRDARISTPPTRGRGGGGGGGGAGRDGPGRGRGGRGGVTGPNRDFGNMNANGFSGGYGGCEDGDVGRPSEGGRGTYGAPRGSFRGGRRGGYGNGEAGGDSDRPPRRVYERHSGTGRGYDTKREGAGRGNWGSATDDALPQETEDNVNADDKIATPEKHLEQEDAPAPEASKDNKEGQANEAEEKEEEKEMTLEEYEKIREEKRKALLAMKGEERKVDFDKEFESMQQLSLKKGNDDVFIKLGSDKELGKKKENVDRDDRFKKSVSINKFLKPAEGERYFSPGDRGRGRGRGRGGDRGAFGGGGGGASAAAPSIEDPGQFPTLN